MLTLFGLSLSQLDDLDTDRVAALIFGVGVQISGATLPRLSLSQARSLSLRQLAILPLSLGSPVYAITLQSVDGYTTNRLAAAVSCVTTSNAASFQTTHAATSAKGSG